MSKKSEAVSGFLTFVRNCQTELPVITADLVNADKQTQDILHALELRKNSAVQLTKLAKSLTLVRRDRRVHKDNIAIMTVVCDWAKRNESAVNDLKQTLGEMRKIEKGEDERIYIYKTNVVQDSIGLTDTVIK